MKKDYTIAVAGTGYVGLSIATLLSQHHKVMAVDIVKEKVDLINNRKSPIQDNYIEKYLAEKELNLTATLDAKEAYSNADFVVIAAPTNYDSATQHFDTSAVEAVIKLVMEYTIVDNVINNIIDCINQYEEHNIVPHVKEYDEIPFIDRDMLLKISYYRKNKRNTLLQTAKGCENTCIFCQRKGWQSCYVTHINTVIIKLWVAVFLY